MLQKNQATQTTEISSTHAIIGMESILGVKRVSEDNEPVGAVRGFEAFASAFESYEDEERISAFCNGEDDDGEKTDEEGGGGSCAVAYRLIHLASTAVIVNNHELLVASQQRALLYLPKSLKPPREDSALYVCEKWVLDLVNRVPVFNIAHMLKYREFLDLEYGTTYKNITKDAYPNAAGLPDRVVWKLLVIDSLLMLMAGEFAKDSRLDKKIRILKLSAVHGETTGHKAGHALLLGRDYGVGDPLTFNRVMRVAQGTHPSWPTGGGKAKGTKGISEAFSIVGLGPSTEARAWNEIAPWVGRKAFKLTSAD
ncbi:hypothetical protein T484DRAFT_1869123 [Baffinella frigidus]|nr:hypothetical protein T484DRAFT_1869123 [Cryptophyta sp. CCMP2293]